MMSLISRRSSIRSSINVAKGGHTVVQFLTAKHLLRDSVRVFAGFCIGFSVCHLMGPVLKDTRVIGVKEWGLDQSRCNNEMPKILPAIECEPCPISCSIKESSGDRFNISR